MTCAPPARVAGVVGALVVWLCCSCAVDSAERDLGPIDDVLSDSTRALWPGEPDDNGGRIIPLIGGFAAGQAAAYWFCGPAPQSTAEIFWFCREGDAACPLDERGAIDFDRVLGGPVFSRMPGERSYSPYWWIRVVRVANDYRADSLKSVAGIEQALREERVRNEWYHFDFAGRVRPDKAIEHSVMVLRDTRLEGNGQLMMGADTTWSQAVPARTGWHKQYRVNYYDFSHTEGVLPPAFEQQEWNAPTMPSAELFVLFRDCVAGSTSEACTRPGPMQGAVSEPALARDLTGDSDSRDSNNLISAVPQDLPLGTSYSPLWAVMEVYVAAQRDPDLVLIDNSGDQNVSDLTDAADIQSLIDTGYLHAPTPMGEERMQTSVAGNDGHVFVDGPAQVPAP